MAEQNMGKLISVYGIAPAYLQRVVIIAVLAFLFFLVTMVMFSMWRNFLYFFLSTAFLIVYMLTMFGWLMLRKNVLKIYENGLTYRKFEALWNEIEAVEAQSDNGKIACEIRTSKGAKITLTESIYGVEQAVGILQAKVKS
jgi:hypothetical protein